jgi:hypothetical protein
MAHNYPDWELHILEWGNCDKMKHFVSKKKANIVFMDWSTISSHLSSSKISILSSNCEGWE